MSTENTHKLALFPNPTTDEVRICENSASMRSNIFAEQASAVQLRVERLVEQLFKADCMACVLAGGLAC